MPLKTKYSPDRLALDFWWCLTSPCLINAENKEFKDLIYTFSQDQKRELGTRNIQFDKTAILNKKVPDLFIGKYFESLIHLAFDQLETTSVLCQGLQLFVGKRTIGELDFIIRQARQLLHIECALKYYLLYEDAHHSRWVGPNGRDALDLKLDKMIQRQFPLLYDPISRTALESRGIELDRIVQKLLLKGQLYIHPEQTFPQKGIASEESEAGKWIHVGEWDRYCGNKKLSWAVLPKMGWLGPLSLQELKNYTIEDIGYLLNKVNTKGPSELVVGYDQTGNQERLFLVPDDWPGLGLT